MFLKKFKNLFSLSKTLRFELKPIGETEENFAKYIKSKDELRAEKFKVVKKYCDEYHKKFIEDCLKDFNDKDFNLLLDEYYSLFFKKEKDEKDFEKTEENLRKIISSKFTKNERYGKLLGEGLVKKLLKEYYKDDKEKLEDIKLFEKFATYFTGYNTNRKNMYKADEIHTAIAFRLVNENLPFFVKNMQIYKKIQEKIPNLKEEIVKNFDVNPNELFSSIQYFSQCITQKQIEKYNNIICGDDKIQGINVLINLHKQKTKEKLPFLKPLYKQILSDSESFVIDEINDDKEAIEIINNFYEDISPILKRSEFLNAFNNIGDNIFIDNDIVLTTLSKVTFDSWSYISDLLEKEFIANYKGKAKPDTKEYIKKKDEYLKSIKTVSIGKIKDLIEKYAAEEEKEDFSIFKNKLKEKFDELVKKINKTYCKDILTSDYVQNSKMLIQDDNKIEKIKKFLDSIKDLQNFLKLFIPKDKTLEIDENFYNSIYYDEISKIIGVYNKIRNYVTQKPYSIEKFPLTFDCSNFLTGWAKIKDFSKAKAHILQKNNDYYLLITNEKISEKEIYTSNEKDAVLFEYDFQKPDYKNFPRIFIRSKSTKFAPAVTECNLPVNEILDIYDNKKYTASYRKINEAEQKKALAKLIDYFKLGMTCHNSYKHFNYCWKNSNEYNDINEFYKDSIESCYAIHKKEIDFNNVLNLVSQGKLFLFQIYNKDFSQHSHGNPNLHTLYFKALFDEENLKNVVYKLSGGGEIFYRKKSIEAKVTHKANEPIQNKTNDKKRTLTYDLIKDKRFTLDKFFIHIPIELNFKAQNITKFNDYTNEQIRNYINDINIIGIDRGERNLIYISIINQKGEIIEQFSLNEINKIDYHKKLDKREKENKETRRSWKNTSTIKELKEGYLSNVIYLISNLVKKYNAIIALEDLNSGFKNSRKKIEKQVYSKFETMLVNKLAYLVDKNEMNGVYNAVQLTHPESKDEYKQNGILFYVPAYHTSKIDPTTGFINLFHIKNMNIEDSKKFIEKIDDIKYNESENYFEFDIDYKKFSDKPCGKIKNWTICTYGQRILTFRNPEKENKFDNKEINLTQEFLNLFNRFKIDFNNLKEEITQKGNREFFDEFFKLFRLTVQMRNSIINSDIDYLISPVKNKTGQFFDSRKKTETLPKNADANGAYNIARKGLILLNRIKENAQGKIDYKIQNEEYYNYIQAQNLNLFIINGRNDINFIFK